LIRASTENRIARIEIHRPEKKNAFTAEMYRQLGAALSKASNDKGVRVVLLHGTRECFSSGNDVGEFLKHRQSGTETPASLLFKALPGLEKPVVAAVAGPAVGIGCTLLLHCDLVFASAGARFQLPFVPLGLVPEFGSTFLLRAGCRLPARSGAVAPRPAVHRGAGEGGRHRECSPAG
jgi:enoyl-CoA hydratase/carnithine racemase